LSSAQDQPIGPAITQGCARWIGKVQGEFPGFGIKTLRKTQTIGLKAALRAFTFRLHSLAKRQKEWHNSPQTS
jgi:hypothetical protein